MKVRYGPAGVHYFDRSTGINVLLDEVRPPSESWSLAPRQVSIALTNACGLSCPHCYAPKHAAQLSVSQVLRWLHEFDRNGCLGVGFGGGEPTNHPHWISLARQAHDQTQMAITMTTHGHNLNDKVIDAVCSSLSFVRVSMDGTRDVYERLRGKPFEVLVDKMKSLKGRIPFGVNCVVNSSTIECLVEAIEIASACGAEEMLFLPQVQTKGVENVGQVTLERLRKLIAADRSGLRFAINSAFSDGYPVCNPFGSEDALSAYAHIDASGIMKRTSYEENGILISDRCLISVLQELRGSYV